MEITKPKRMLPDRAIACVIFSFLSVFTFRVYGQLLWGTHDDSADGIAAIGSILGSLETTRRVLAVVALLWCVWSWWKEWWLPSVTATICTALALFSSFFIDS